MADVYCVQDLGSGLDNGTSWIDAYKLLSVALDGTKVGAGDTLWVKNNKSTTGLVILKGKTDFSNDPPRVIGCISAASNTPPLASEIVPGLRNGSSTRAYDQTGANEPPTLTLTGSGNDMELEGWFSLIYGLVLKAQDNFTILNQESVLPIEECHFRAGDGSSGVYILGASSGVRYLRAKNSKFSAGTGGQLAFSREGFMLFKGCEFDIPNATYTTMGGVNVIFDGCNFSAQSGTLVGNGGGTQINAPVQFLNCKIHASSALVSGSISEKFRTEFVHVSSATGKTTGQTFQEIDIITNNGNIVEETTRFRTGGADDGGTGKWSLAFTPNINGTRDNREGLIGPKMAVEVIGDGTSQTLTVYIANDLAESDPANTYNDDDVWLEAKSPSEAGTADYDFYTTQMDLLATPSQITTETDSTWGSGANNRQKLEITLSPDYDGIIECWVVFAKNFGASPDTLYVDPLPVLS